MFKRGSYIKLLEKKSCALISISETTTFEHDIMWKFVHLSGSGRAVDKAKKLLHTVCFDSTQQGGIATTLEEAEEGEGEEAEVEVTVEDREISTQEEVAAGILSKHSCLV